jgi:ribosomal protein S8E
MGYTSKYAQKRLSKYGKTKEEREKAKSELDNVTTDSKGRKVGTKTKTRKTLSGAVIKKTTQYSPDDTVMKKTVKERIRGGNVTRRKVKTKLRKPKAGVSFGELKTKQKGFSNQGGNSKSFKKGYGTNKSIQ